jgi:hypothetical protein
MQREEEGSERMDPKIRTQFEAAISEVLERFAFMFQEPEGEAVAGVPGLDAPLDAYQATMEYTGADACGRLRVSAPQALCRDMAANILGRERDAVSSEDAEDSLKEFLNIVCGRLTGLLYGQKAVIQLSVPVLHRFDANRWIQARSEPGAFEFTVEGHPFLAAICVGPTNSKKG